MAFVASHFRAANAIRSGGRSVCARLPTTRRAAATAGPATTMSVEPLNADKSMIMKEAYEVAVGSKAAVCRCWKSKKHPLCDGSHAAFNKETGSNVGPLVINATAPKE